MLLRLAGIFGFLAVAAGAFGAHALKDRLTPEMLEIFEVGVRYHLVHAVVLLVVALIGNDVARMRKAGWCLVAGMAVFSGSLYILALSGVRWLGAITPIGGLFLLAGWLLIAFSAPLSDRGPSGEA